ncbi:SDR family NAD(P)-dependent oxidoreductase [Calidithermus chliarophilus]|uniref:SDR family NAD(P)-dependent oxidoreductase n=1 Tax=Calidithermus chliarophilus TaxID=52023 RepID=UPI00048202ED|nr:SDR family NAD(P)-dependent oxidoreductase [Calidithermus chliarophilus]
MTSLTGKSALVTGASGIAAATARHLAGLGAGVMVLDKSGENLSRLESELPGVACFEADLLEPSAPDAAVAAVLGRFGRLDVLVNAAGISGRRFGDGPVHEATDAGWDIVMDTNARSTFRMCRAALGPMLEQGSGAIVNVASVLAYAPAREFFATHAYAACNGARIALTKAMAAYYAPHGIRVNAVAPGLIATPMSARAQGDPAILGYVRVRQPLTGKLGTPEDVAQAIGYLASDAARFVTGVVLEVSGGWSVAG